MKFRKEKDTMGEVLIPENRLWGTQTSRSIENFKIGKETFTREMIWALAVVKKCVAQVNYQFQLLDWEQSEAIQQAAIEVMEGKWDEHFPLVIWQTGSGTQTNMNTNEVIANRATQLLGGHLGDKNLIHPNDHVNRSQSSNDVFPTAMHIATIEKLQVHLKPALKELKDQLIQKQNEFRQYVKIGRTHLMDATPIRFDQEFSAYVCQIEKCEQRIQSCESDLYELALGGTAVGTGLNTIQSFDQKVALAIAKETGRPFISASNKFEAISAHSALVQLSASLKTLATAFMKMGNDIRLMGSGPRCGLGELLLPANEPGSSIMPGKVNPTQCEALTMVCGQVIGNDTAVTIGGMEGHLELNAFKPLIIRNILHSIELLGDVSLNFSKKCLKGMQVNQKVIQKYTDQCLMLATALNPSIGYDKASQIVYAAHKNGTTLKEETVRLGYLTADEFDQQIQVKNMTQPSKK